MEAGEDRRDRDLITRTARGDPQALAALYDRYADRLFGHAFAITRNRADAEDLVQATFVRLAGAGANLPRIRFPAGYLHQAVRLGAIDMARRRAVREKAVEASGRPRVADAPGQPIDRIALERALGTLPVEQREAVLLHLVEGFSFREIGAATGASTFTAASRYRIGLERLRRAFGRT